MSKQTMRHLRTLARADVPFNRRRVLGPLIETRILLAVAFLGIAACAAPMRPLAKSPHVPIAPSEKRQITAFTEMVHAVNVGDAKRYAGLYAQHAVITIYGGDRLKRRDAIEQYEVELLRQFPGTRLGFYAIWQKGSAAVVHYAVNGRTPSGQRMGHEGLLFYRFDPSGRIEEERRYIDSLTPMAQMGMLGALPVRPAPTLPTELNVYRTKSSSNESQNVALVRASVAAWDAKNEAGFLSNVSEDAIFDELILRQPFVGKGNVKHWFETWVGAVPDGRSEIIKILGIGEFILVETIVRGTLKSSLGPLSASTKQFAVHRAAIVQVKGGVLTRVSCFMNGKGLAEAVGEWPLTLER
jgi:ketosteroid isomerase-like protein